MASPAPCPPAFAAAFVAADAARAQPAGPTLRFDHFMALALYHPTLGYYRQDRLRVGRDRAADFYTASSLGPLFGELIVAAATTLLRQAELDPATYTFIELGAEPGHGVLSAATAHPFANHHCLRLGQALTLNGPAVVFSNELFDAQPVRRFRRGPSAWHELGVQLTAPDSPAPALVECDLGPASIEDLTWLPAWAETPEGYHFDAPRAAAALATALAAQPWHGLFLAFDYGKTFAELGHAHPVGTARAYHRHTQSNALLAHPGEQDLTAHVCWDWLSAALAPHTHPTQPPTVLSQESFFVHYAGDFLATQMAQSASLPASDPRKRSLLHLLHPAQMGQKFQVLHALKPAPRPSGRDPA